MQEAGTYKRYAIECERIARTMSGENRSSLLAIAEACLSLRATRSGRTPLPQAGTVKLAWATTEAMVGWPEKRAKTIQRKSSRRP
jgi:hypothetical protein